MTALETSLVEVVLKAEAAMRKAGLTTADPIRLALYWALIEHRDVTDITPAVERLKETL